VAVRVTEDPEVARGLTIVCEEAAFPRGAPVTYLNGKRCAPVSAFTEFLRHRNDRLARDRACGRPRDRRAPGLILTGNRRRASILSEHRVNTT
jgi:hypothetical protein